MSDLPESERGSGRGTTRRRVLVLFAALGVAGVATLPWLGRLGRRARDDHRLRRLLGLELDGSRGVGELEPDELDVLAALGDVIYPSDFAAEPRSQAFSRSTAQQLARTIPGYHVELRAGVQLLEERAQVVHGRTFSTLPLGERTELFESLVGPLIRARPRRRFFLLLRDDGAARWRLWRFSARGLLRAFYRSPDGWRVVGYPFPPGTCSDLSHYQEPPRLG